MTEKSKIFQEADLSSYVCLGVIVASHGVRGYVKIKTFTENPENLSSYGDLLDLRGNHYVVNIQEIRSSNSVIAAIKGVQDRNQADSLKGVQLFVSRSSLPQPEEDEFYYSDLIGLLVKTDDEENIGHIKAVHNFGAGDILEVITSQHTSIMIPFRKEIVPDIKLSQKEVIVSSQYLASLNQPDQP